MARGDLRRALIPLRPSYQHGVEIEPTKNGLSISVRNDRSFVVIDADSGSVLYERTVVGPARETDVWLAWEQWRLFTRRVLAGAVLCTITLVVGTSLLAGDPLFWLTERMRLSLVFVVVSWLLMAGALGMRRLDVAEALQRSPEHALRAIADRAFESAPWIFFSLIPGLICTYAAIEQALAVR